MTETPETLPELPYGLSYGWVVPEPEDIDEDLWLRFAADEVLPVRVISPQALTYRGHWYPAVGAYRLCQAQRDQAGRVLSSGSCLLCPRPNSSGKPIASPARVRHLLTVELPGGAQRIWEFSEAVARQLQTITGWQRGPGGAITRTRELAGLRVLLARLPPRSNGAVVVQLDPEPDARGICRHRLTPPPTCPNAGVGPQSKTAKPRRPCRSAESRMDAPYRQREAHSQFRTGAKRPFVPVLLPSAARAEKETKTKKE